MPLSKEFYLDEIKSKYPNSYNESLKDLPIKDLEDMLDFLESALEKADGGSIGIEVLFGPKRDEFSIGGNVKKNQPYDPRASIQDYAAALQKVGGGTDAQKLQDIGRYGLSQMQNSPNFFKAVGQGINQHMINNQMLRDALDAKRITEDQYKLMGGYDVARLSPKIGLGNIKIGGTPGDVGIASAIYNAIKAGGIGAEKLGIKETDPYNQYGDIGFFGSIAKNYQGAKGLSESDKTLYESIISGKTQSDIDRFRSGLYAANQVDKATGDRLYGGNIENLFEQYKKSPSTFFYAGDDTQSMYDRFNKYYADGGRVGLFMGGPPLEGTALSIYNSMSAYGFSDQEIADALAERGLYTPGGTTEETGIIASAPNIINQQTGGDGPSTPPGPTFNRNDLLGTSDYQGTGPGFIESILGIPAALVNAYSKISPMNFVKNIFKPNVQTYYNQPNLDAIAKAEEERKAKAAAERAAFLAEQQRTNIASQLGGPDGQSGGKYAGGEAFASANPYGGSGTMDDLGADSFKDGGLATMFKKKR